MGFRFSNEAPAPIRVRATSVNFTTGSSFPTTILHAAAIDTIESINAGSGWAADEARQCHHDECDVAEPPALLPGDLGYHREHRLLAECEDCGLHGQHGQELHRLSGLVFDHEGVPGA